MQPTPCAFTTAMPLHRRHQSLTRSNDPRPRPRNPAPATVIARRTRALRARNARCTHVAQAALGLGVDVVDVDVFADASDASGAQLERRTARALPVVIVPGYGSDAAAYGPMRALLAEELGPGACVHVVPVRAATWARTLGGRPVTPILELLDGAVRAALEESGAEKVHLVAHSAGGWIARIYLGSKPYFGREWRGAEVVDTLLCLGTPQRSAEPITMGNMKFVNKEYPGAYEADVRYVCIAGDGCTIADGGLAANWRFWERDWFARVSYRLTDAEATGLVGGDGTLKEEMRFSFISFSSFVGDTVASSKYLTTLLAWRGTCDRHCAALGGVLGGRGCQRENARSLALATVSRPLVRGPARGSILGKVCALKKRVYKEAWRKIQKHICARTRQQKCMRLYKRL